MCYHGLSSFNLELDSLPLLLQLIIFLIKQINNQEKTLMGVRQNKLKLKKIKPHRQQKLWAITQFQNILFFLIFHIRFAWTVLINIEYLSIRFQCQDDELYAWNEFIIASWGNKTGCHERSWFAYLSNKLLISPSNRQCLMLWILKIVNTFQLIWIFQNLLIA